MPPYFIPSALLALLPMCNISTHRLDCQCRLLPRPKKTSRSGDDVSRLLDPSYSSSTSSRSSSSTQTTVYIDPEGELHDPDYRHFPSVGGRKVPEALDDQVLEAEQRFLAPMLSSPPFSAPPYGYPEPGNTSATSKLKKPQQLRRSYTTYSSEPSRTAAASFTDYFGDGDDSSEFSDKETDTSYSVSDKGDETHQPCTACRETMMKEWHSLSLSWNIGVYRMKKRLRRAFSAEEIPFGQTPTESSGSCRFCLLKKHCESRRSSRKSRATSPNSEKILESVS